MTTPANNQNPAEGLSPENLASRLCDIMLQSGISDPAALSQGVIDFLGASLLYALTSAKRDPILFFTETLLYFAGNSSPDPAQRSAMLKKIGDTFLVNAAAAAVPPAVAPAGTAPVAGPPAAPSADAPAPAGPPVGPPPGVPTPPKP
jgi:hypothetical protein